jgi:hypothetical protein
LWECLIETDGRMLLLGGRPSEMGGARPQSGLVLRVKAAIP